MDKTDVTPVILSCDIVTQPYPATKL